MCKYIVCLLLMVSLGIISPLLSAQQNQSAQKVETEIDALRKRVAELETQLKTVENVEKMDLHAKLAEANAKLANAEFGKFERELRDSNYKWLTGWIALFLAILSAVGFRVWSWLKSRTNELIETEVEKNINEFKEAVKAQDLIKNRLGMLEKQYVASVLRSVINHNLLDEHHHPQPIEALREEVLLQVFDDEKTYYPIDIYKAAEVLAARKSPRLIPPLLDRLNLEANSEPDPVAHYNVSVLTRPPSWPDAVKFLASMCTLEAYDGLKRFLTYLLTDDPISRDLFLGNTVSSLVQVSIKLTRGNSVSVLRMAIPHLNNLQLERESLGELANYFDIFNEPIGIKEILIYHVASERLGMEDIKNRCLELLEKYDPEFVNEWRARETTDNSEA